MTKIRISTNYGDLVVKLYDQTPLHRDNFIKLVKEGFYEGTLFHRVIKGFMIQGGDPDSKGAPKGKRLGSGDVGYTIPAEIEPSLFHKRGALCAARQGDQVNPERRSSGCQFYIVWGEKFSGSKMDQMDRQYQMQAINEVFSQLASQHRDEIMQMRRDRNRDALMELQQQLEAEANAIVVEKGLGRIPEERRNAYMSEGGTPFLDNQYTVFGELESGFDIVEKIQNVQTEEADRPLEDVKILSATII